MYYKDTKYKKDSNNCSWLLSKNAAKSITVSYNTIINSRGLTMRNLFPFQCPTIDEIKVFIRKMTLAFFITVFLQLYHLTKK